MKVVSMFSQGEHKNKSGIDEIVKIKSFMNDKRSVFIWDHLQNFYNLNRGNISPIFLSAHRHYSTGESVVPVKIYLNADLDKQSIITENKGKSGIYI
jgi:hypothetical protein